MRLKYSCKYPNCKNAYYWNRPSPMKNKHFYSFPKKSKKKLLDEWKRICNIAEDVNCDHAFVCEDHFLPKDFINYTRHRINRDVVPKKPTLHVNIPCVSLNDHTDNGTSVSKNDPLDDGATHYEDNKLNSTPKSRNLKVIKGLEINSQPQPAVPALLQSCPESSMDSHEDNIHNSDGNNLISLPNNVIIDTLDNSHTASDNTELVDSLDHLGRFDFLTWPLESNNENDHQILGSKEKLTAYELQMYKIHNDIMAKFTKLKYLLKKEKQPIKLLEKLYNTSKFKNIYEDLGEVSREFVNGQLKNAKKKSSRNWTKEEKASALSLYIGGSRLYKYLLLHFRLPSIESLKVLQSKMSFETGLNRSTLNVLKTEIKRMHEMDKYCALLFNEMRLDKGLHYDPDRQRICGYQDLGHLGRSPILANNVLVFMIRGVQKPWKQVIAYYFTKDSISSDHLKTLIVGIVSQLQNVGFNIVSTVCAQTPTNQQVLQELCNENLEQPSQSQFVVNNKVITIIYDVPHLLKSTRDALVGHKIRFDRQKEAKFKYIEKLFNMDENKKFKTLPKLRKEYFNFSDDHIKGKVKVAAQQMSATVAAGIETLVLTKSFPPEAMYTAEFINYIDSLFDSLNGYSQHEVEDKIYRCALSGISPHIELWTDVLSQLKKWKIINITTGKDKTESFRFIDGWQITIKSVMSLWENLKEVGVTYLNLRSLNLDPLENLFFCIRQLGTGKDLTCFHFETALITCIINKLSMLFKNSGNCKNDECIQLNNLIRYLVESAEDENFTGETQDLSLYLQKKFYSEYNPIGSENLSTVLAEIAAYILKVIKIDKTCITCTRNLFAPDFMKKSFKFQDNSCAPLVYVSEDLLIFLEYILEELYNFLSKQCYMNDLNDNFKIVFHRNESTTFCVEHLPELSILDEAIPFLIFKYIKDMNQLKNKRAQPSRHSKYLKRFKSGR